MYNRIWRDSFAFGYLVIVVLVSGYLPCLEDSYTEAQAPRGHAEPGFGREGRNGHHWMRC